MIRTLIFALLALASTASAAAGGALYGAEVWGSAQLVSLNVDSGQSTHVGYFGTGDIEAPYGMAYSWASNTTYLLNDPSNGGGLYSVDLKTGAATAVGATGTYAGIAARGLAWRAATNQLFTVDINTNTLYRVDMTTGAISNPLALPNSGGYSGITYDNAADVLYGIASVVVGMGTGRHVVKIDPLTGVATSVYSLGSGNDYRGVAFDTDLGLLWTHNNTTGLLTSIDLAKGVLIPVGTTQQPGLSGTSLNALVFVPTPAVAWCGLAAVVSARRGRQRRA